METVVARKMKRGARRRGGLTVDQSVIAVLIAAMDANQHVSPEEAARAHHIIWSMRRFRRKSGETVDRLIETVRDRIEEDGMSAVLQQAARTVPPVCGHLPSPSRWTSCWLMPSSSVKSGSS